MSVKQDINAIFGSEVIVNIKRALILTKIKIKVYKKRIDIEAPFYLTNKSLGQLVKKKNSWIKKQLNIQSKFNVFKKKEYLNGENFLFLGVVYKLKIIENNEKFVCIKGNFLQVYIKNKKDISKIKKMIKEWYFKNSLIYFREKTNNYAKSNHLNVNSVKIKDYKARWGSCSTSGDISFNWRLIMSPPKIIEYVIIHELMHLKEHNHSPRYWDHVKSIYPNIKDAKEWLIYNGQTLNI